MRKVWILLVFSCLFAPIGCGAEDVPPDDDYETTPAPSSETTGSDRVERKLAAWPGIFAGPLGDQVSAAEAKAVLGLDAEPEVVKSDYSELWRYRWLGEDGERREMTLDLMPLTDEGMIQLNANGYRTASEQGRGDAVDLGEDGVWAFWRVERKKARLIVFTRTRVFTVGAVGIPAEEAQPLAVAVARHVFEKNR